MKKQSLWSKINPYKAFTRLCGWLGPRGSVVFICSIIWIQTGIGTLQGYSGRPTDAPHLLIPGAIRGTVWIICAVIALCYAPTRSIKGHRTAITFLSIMPVVRLVSYLISWIFSWSVFQAMFPHFPLKGAAQGEYGSTFWQADLVLIVMLMFAPATWEMVRRYITQEEEYGGYARKFSGLKFVKVDSNISHEESQAYKELNERIGGDKK